MEWRTKKKFKKIFYNMWRKNPLLSNMLYFLCKSPGKWWQSGKNVFDFTKKCRYNVSYRPFLALFWRKDE